MAGVYKNFDKTRAEVYRKIQVILENRQKVKVDIHVIHKIVDSMFAYAAKTIREGEESVLIPRLVRFKNRKEEVEAFRQFKRQLTKDGILDEVERYHKTVQFATIRDIQRKARIAAQPKRLPQKRIRKRDWSSKPIIKLTRKVNNS